mmetsp:Transcript_21936/g.52415  ORF Transcript_21936/g.52415 Transcript_21936/m.52415 type:complete len:95 (+) Transcript_21936:941-1225(+)
MAHALTPELIAKSSLNGIVMCFADRRDFGSFVHGIDCEPPMLKQSGSGGTPMRISLSGCCNEAPGKRTDSGRDIQDLRKDILLDGCTVVSFEGS